jgi:hypothetical protein
MAWNEISVEAWGGAPDQSGIVLQDVLQETPLGVVTQSMVVIAMSRPRSVA